MTYDDLRMSLSMLTKDQLKKPVVIFDCESDSSHEISWIIHALSAHPEIEIIYEKEINYDVG